MPTVFGVYLKHIILRSILSSALGVLDDNYTLYLQTRESSTGCMARDDSPASSTAAAMRGKVVSKFET